MSLQELTLKLGQFLDENQGDFFFKELAQKFETTTLNIGHCVKRLEKLGRTDVHRIKRVTAK